MRKFTLGDKFPRIVVVKIENGFLVGIFPENKEVQKMMQGYVKQIMDAMTNLDGDEWKIKMQENIDKALKGTSNDNIRILACKNSYEVMEIIAPLPEGEKPKKDKPDLSWFWSDEGYIPD